MDKKMATKRQLFALFCITRKDYRNENLTYDEASALIDKLNSENGYVGKAPKAGKENRAIEFFEKAKQAGLEALNACTPVPMTVQQRVSPLDDNSPVVQEWRVDGGVCGFAWITFKANTPENRKFLAGLKKADLVGNVNDNREWSKSLSGPGYMFWVREGGQSMQKKEAYAYAFVKSLRENGIEAYSHSRID